MDAPTAAPARSWPQALTVASVRGSLASPAVRAALLSVFVSFVILGLNLATGVILARGLGPDLRGELAAVLLWPALIAPLGSLGMTDAVTYFAARRGDPAGEIAGTGVAIGAVQALVLSGAAAIVLPAVLAARGVSSGAVYLSLLYIPLFLLADTLIYLLNGLGRHATFQGFRLAMPVLVAAMFVGLWLTGNLTVIAAVSATLGAYAVLIALAALLVSRRGPWRFSAGLGRRMLSFGLRSHVSTASSLLSQRVDQLAVSLLLPTSELGVYVIAVAVASLPGVIGYAVGLVALPRVAAGASVDAACKAAQRTLWLSTLLAAALMALAPRLIHLFFGAAYQDAAGPALILLAAAVFASWSRVLAALLKAVGAPMTAGVADAVGLAVAVAGLAVLVPQFGTTGAAIALLVASACNAALMARSCASALGVHIHALALPRGLNLPS